MKKNLKRNLFIFFIFAFGITAGVGAAVVYYSQEISYTPTDSTWNVSNVKEALDSLYTVKTGLDEIKAYGTATAGQIASGKTAIVKGQKITGTLPSQSASNQTLQPSTSVTYNAGNYSSAWTVSAAAGNPYKYYAFSHKAATANTPYTLKLGTWTSLAWTSKSGYGYSSFSIDLGFTPTTTVKCYAKLSGNWSTDNENLWDPSFRFLRGYAYGSSDLQYYYLGPVPTGMHISTTGYNDQYSDYVTDCSVRGSKLYFYVNYFRQPDPSSTTKMGFHTRADAFTMSGYIVYQ